MIYAVITMVGASAQPTTTTERLDMISYRLNTNRLQSRNLTAQSGAKCCWSKCCLSPEVSVRELQQRRHEAEQDNWFCKPESTAYIQKVYAYMNAPECETHAYF